MIRAKQRFEAAPSTEELPVCLFQLLIQCRWMRARDLFLSSQLTSQEVDKLLGEYGFQDTEQADQYLQRIAERVGFGERLAELGSSLLDSLSRAADPDAALLHLTTFFESTPNAPNLVSYLEESPSALHMLVQTLGASSFLAQVLFRNPEYFYWLQEEDGLRRTEGSDYFLAQAGEMIRPFDGKEDSLDALRRLRRREMLRIGSQDILRTARLEDTVRQISHLTDAILKTTFEILARETLPSHSPFAVLALGKLGGHELNFSSDVDLIYIYDHEQDRDQMLRFARDYTRSLSEHTPEGRLYRVDLRLRPMGQSGEIAYSLDACRHYYETWADTFDRLALIKCRWVAGDADLGNRFVELIQDFVYKRYLDTAAVEEIGWLKRRIDQELAAGRKERNIKYGLGGIREIEFFVQAFQLLSGGQQPAIRSANTLEALDLLVDNGLISVDDHKTLQQAYRFWRNLEHKLQLVYDLQTHVLPDDESELTRCARRMGYQDSEKDEAPRTALEVFLHDLEHQRQAAHQIFSSLFEAEKPVGLQEVVLNSQMDRQEAIAKIEAEGIGQAAEFYEGIVLLQQAPSFPHSPGRIRNLLANLVPLLVEHTSLTEHPRNLFARLDRFAESLGSRASLYSELVENREFRNRFLKILGSGEFLSETLIYSPELLDSVSKLPPPGISYNELERTVHRVVSAGRKADYGLRLFKRREEFKVGLYDLFHKSPLQSRRWLSELADLCVRWTAFSICDDSGELAQEDFSLLALGKLGGQELTYHSDLDLILVFDQQKTSTAQESFSELLRRVHDELELYTELGRSYKLDLRLRPEGKYGALAIPCQSLAEYFRTRAEPWERLAYVKLRALDGFSHGIDLNSLIWEKPFSTEEVIELNRIRMRKEVEIGAEQHSSRFDFKVGYGGLMDIQFVVQYLQIQHGVKETNTLQACHQLVAEGYLDEAAGDTLGQGQKFLFSLETMQRLLQERPSNTLSKEASPNDLLARFLDVESGKALLERYLSEREKIRAVYRQFFPADD